MGEKEEIIKIKNNKINIMGYSFQRLIAYFIIYSFIGFLLETLFAVMTKGTLESRQSVLYGPFCMIYGIGAIIMLIFLRFFNKNNNSLFWGGFIIGSITEYVLSYLGEALFNVVWWNYSEMPLNINGRICMFFSIFWGLLAIYLISYVNPKVDKIIDYLKKRINIKHIKTTLVVVVIFLIIDNVLTFAAVKFFYIRMIHNNDIQVENREEVEKEYNEIYNNEKLSWIIETFFNDKIVIRTFPNLKVVDAKGEVKFFHTYLPDIRPYYYRFQNAISRSISEMLKTDTYVSMGPGAK